VFTYYLLVPFVLVSAVARRVGSEPANFNAFTLSDTTTIYTDFTSIVVKVKDY
jgi:hypothetical protein